MDILEELVKCEDFGCIFNLVRKTVDAAINMRRAGLMMGMQSMPNYIGAYHPVGTDFIVMNKSVYDMVRNMHGREIANAYAFYIIMHEYLHTLGFYDEKTVRYLSHEICYKLFGKNNLITKIARHGFGILMPPEGNMHIDPVYSGIEVINDFDMDETSYIG